MAKTSFRADGDDLESLSRQISSLYGDELLETQSRSEVLGRFVELASERPELVVELFEDDPFSDVEPLEDFS